MPKGIKPKNFEEFQKKGWESNKGRKPWHAGKTGVFSKETLEKMRLAKLGKFTGKKSPAYKNGKWTKENRAKTRREMRRKSVLCKVCKKPFLRKQGSSYIYCDECSYIQCKCKSCGRLFPFLRKFVIQGRGKFCSIECANKIIGFSTERNGGKKHWNWKGGIDSVIAYRARKRKATGNHTIQDWEDLKKKYDYMCLCCKRFEPEIKLSEDHITPLSIGGTNDISNIQPLCRNCNAKKWKNIKDFRN